MNLHQFYYDAWKLSLDRKWRLGQALFNHLATVRQDLAEEIRGTENDPFYAESFTDPRYDVAIKFIERRWFE